MPLRALARVNLAAIERNVQQLLRGLTPGTSLCAVVKADGYGHGAVRPHAPRCAAGRRRWPSPPRGRRPSCAPPGSSRRRFS